MTQAIIPGSQIFYIPTTVGAICLFGRLLLLFFFRNCTPAIDVPHLHARVDLMRAAHQAERGCSGLCPMRQRIAHYDGLAQVQVPRVHRWIKRSLKLSLRWIFLILQTQSSGTPRLPSNCSMTKGLTRLLFRGSSIERARDYYEFL